MATSQCFFLSSSLVMRGMFRVQKILTSFPVILTVGGQVDHVCIKWGT